MKAYVSLQKHGKNQLSIATICANICTLEFNAFRITTSICRRRNTSATVSVVKENSSQKDHKDNDVSKTRQMQSHKNPVSASAMLTGKFLRQAHYWLKNFRILCNTKYPDNMQSVRMNWKVCLDNHESFQMILKCPVTLEIVSG